MALQGAMAAKSGVSGGILWLFEAQTRNYNLENANPNVNFENGFENGPRSHIRHYTGNRRQELRQKVSFLGSAPFPSLKNVESSAIWPHEGHR
eukprot:scaffold1850_cov194-Pinguiococcus_pyrenoidosus.AAC.25